MPIITPERGASILYSLSQQGGNAEYLFSLRSGRGRQNGSTRAWGFEFAGFDCGTEQKNEKVKKIIKKLPAIIAGTPCRTPSEKRGKLATGAGKRAVLNKNISSFSAYLT